LKTIQWDDSLSVEVDEIDEDHRRLIDLFNILSTSVAKNDSAEYVQAVLEELISCTVWHFRHEERLMLLHNYPNIAEHKAEHTALIESAGQLQANFQKELRLLTNDEIDYLEEWLTEHILGHDMRLGFYLIKVM
jgi:hemerythrin-like metal-binding protein